MVNKCIGPLDRKEKHMQATYYTNVRQKAKPYKFSSLQYPHQQCTSLSHAWICSGSTNGSHLLLLCCGRCICINIRKKWKRHTNGQTDTRLLLYIHQYEHDQHKNAHLQLTLKMSCNDSAVTTIIYYYHHLKLSTQLSKNQQTA